MSYMVTRLVCFFLDVLAPAGVDTMIRLLRGTSVAVREDTSLAIDQRPHFTNNEAAIPPPLNYA